MARIRTIKPEFPQSETVGHLSRDARLLFIQLWTIADDEGRARAASRMLASLLYPYDDDAPGLIDGWLSELEQKGCIRRYTTEGATYLEIINWLKHQKIDHASKSKFPAPDDVIANPREPSRTLAPDLGPRTKDQEREGGAREPLISPEAFEIFEIVLKAMGTDVHDIRYAGFPNFAQTWLTQKIPKDFIIQTCARLPGKHLNYLDKAVTNGWQDRQNEQQNPREPRHAKPGKRNAIMEALEQHAENIGQSERSYGFGESPPRLLSHG